MNKILFYVMAGMILFTSCDRDEGPDVDDNFLNFEIPVIKQTEEYPVGVYYRNPGGGGQDKARYERLMMEFDTKEGRLGPWLEPVLGNYGIDQNSNNITDEMIAVVQQQVDWCIDGGVDFWIYPSIKAKKNTLAPNCMEGDERLYNILRGTVGSDVKGSGKKVNMKSLKFVATVNIEDPLCKNNWETYNADGTLTGKKTTTLSNTVLLDANNDICSWVDGKGYTRTDMFAEFFKSLNLFFQDEHYYRVDGKPMVVLQNAHKLYTADCKAFYNELRAAVKAAIGEDLFLVAQQDQWSPPARFEYFFKGGVDAVTNKNMYNNNEWTRSVAYDKFIYLNWEYHREFFRDNWGGTDFIPTGAPAFNSYVDNQSKDKPLVLHDLNVFRTMCNVMKSQAGKHKIIFIDSFNDFQYASFIEPTKTDYGNGYGTEFLDIIKEEFDVR